MNLATPAPQVEPATAETVQEAEEAVADMPEQSEPVHVAAVEQVDPAVTYDDPMQFAPSNLVLIPKHNNTETTTTTSKEATAATTNDDYSIQVLRGTSGSDFEGYAAVFRGAPEKNFLKRCLPCIYDERDFITYGEVKRYILVKGSTCFVFLQASDPHPQYAIPFDDANDNDALYPVWEDPLHPEPGSVTVSPMPGTNKPRPEMVTILLKKKTTNKHVFQFTFDTSQDKTLAQRFYDVVLTAVHSSIHDNDNSKSATGTATSKGAKAPPHVTASVMEAKRYGKEAAKAQPEI